MAVVKIVQHEFTDRETNKITPYERLAIIGYVGGEIHTLELRLEKSELLLAKMLLTSKEEEPETTSRKANELEIDDFLSLNSK